MQRLDCLKQILEILDAKGIRYKYHSWVNIPTDHCFATWFVPSEKFDGADLQNFYEDYTLQIALFYKKSKDTADFENECAFEDELRGAGVFSKLCSFDNSNELFTSVYTFEFRQFI